MLYLAALTHCDFVYFVNVLHCAVYGGVVLSGWLRRQEGATALSRKWKDRYAVLTEYGQLKWYKGSSRSKYLGLIDVVGTLSSVSFGARSSTECQLDLHTKYGNVWLIGCDDDGQRQSWNDRITELLPDQHPMGHFVYSETSETMMDDAVHSLNDPLPPQLLQPQPPPPPGPPPKDIVPDAAMEAVMDSMTAPEAERREECDGMDIDDAVEPMNAPKESAESGPSSAAKVEEQRRRRREKGHRHGAATSGSVSGRGLFGDAAVFEAECKSLRKCHSVQRLIECMHIWNGNGDEERINELLAQNGHFGADYEHILRWHLDAKNEFQALYKHVLRHIRHGDLHSHRTLTLPHEAHHNTFYVNAMYVIHSYFFGNLV